MFQVKKKQCDQCLLTKNRIVSTARMRQILRDCKANDGHFICHKATIDGNKDHCCRGFYNANPYATNLMRISHRLSMVEFVD